MKRRDFIIASAGVIGSAVPSLSRGQTVPCPPPSLRVAGGGTVSTGCGPGSAPSWFVNQTDGTWTQIAGGSSMSQGWQRGRRVFDVKPDPLPPGNDGLNAIHNNWTGACANQELGEYYLPAQGGHDGYYGNEIYALRLRDEIPSWERIWGPTPNASIVNSSLGFNAANTSYADGNVRSQHGWFAPQVSNDGRIWQVGAGSYGSPGGHWSTTVWSIDRNNLAAGWMYHGRLYTYIPGGAGDSTFSYYSGPVAYDRVANRFWRAADYATQDGVVTFDAAQAVAAGRRDLSSGPAVASIRIYDVPLYGNPLSDAWSVVTDGLTPRCWIVGAPNESMLYIMDLQNKPGEFVTRNVGGTPPPGWGKFMGAVWHGPSRSILVGGTEGAPNVYRLSMSSSNPMSASYSWSRVALGSSNSVTPSPGYQYNGTFGKWQMIEDMGNGQSAIVLMSNVEGPTYVFKVPR